jgi:hypothetical protein
MARYATVDEYIAALPGELASAAAQIRLLVGRELPDASEAIKWAQPVWSIGREPVCYLKAASRHVTFGFWRGASFHDPSGRLESGGQVMAHVKVRGASDVDEPLFMDWLRQARAQLAR